MRLLGPVLNDPPDGVRGRVLPVDFAALRRIVPRITRETRPTKWILTGECGDDDALRFEQVAINLLEGHTPDNAGRMPPGKRAVRNGPDAYFTTLGPRSLKTAFEARGIPSRLSHHAGTYACNLALYLALHNSRKHDIPVEIGFIHVPRHYRQTGRNLREIREAFLDVLEVLRHEVDGADAVVSG